MPSAPLPSETTIRRLAALRGILRKARLDGFLVTNLKNVRYLTGFTGSSAFALVTRDRALFFTDFRYVEQAEHEVGGFERVMEKGKRRNLIGRLCRRLGIGRLGFEATVAYAFYEDLAGLRVTLSPRRGDIERLRAVKDREELEAISKAIARAEEAFLAVKPRIRPGATERSIALALETELKRRGCKHAAFDIIVASGPHASMPHAQPTGRKIGKGDFVIIDWGGEADGYYSDMTRTLLMAGGDLSRQRNIYSIVDRAREKAIAAVSEERTTFEVDAAAREHITAAGFGDAFGHGTGHGIGLDVHEFPRLSRLTRDSLASGMVFSVEPGIYVPGVGGVRIEDLVLVDGRRGAVLTTLGRDLEIIN